ncbi:MAG: SufD family Fe-S cluster assembly protein [Candidatus Thermoplasmatota archaeon]|nr:SufD family Fe-S cluster assembly protein [Candidatus Thermoplasmatota archaeon]
MDMNNLLEMAGVNGALQDPDTAHLAIDVHRVMSKNLVPGLQVETEEAEGVIRVRIRVEEGAHIHRPVHLCFGITHQQAQQLIDMDVEVGRKARIEVLSHCIFPRATDVRHQMQARIHVGEDASYRYLEKHIHSDRGGLAVYPSAQVELERGARFSTDFELVRGRVGTLAIDYVLTGRDHSILEMVSRVNGRGDDDISIREVGYLVGEHARGALTSRVAVRDRAQAQVYNKLRATAPHARGHVDCKEIIQDDGKATAIPIVEVVHPLAHVTHEAAIGSVDTKQLETLMARGLDEDQATELIIEGLLS